MIGAGESDGAGLVRDQVSPGVGTWWSEAERDGVPVSGTAGLEGVGEMLTVGVGNRGVDSPSVTTVLMKATPVLISHIRCEIT